MSGSASGMKAAKLFAKAAKLGGKAAFKKAAAGKGLAVGAGKGAVLAGKGAALAGKGATLLLKGAGIFMTAAATVNVTEKALNSVDTGPQDDATAAEVPSNDNAGRESLGWLGPAALRGLGATAGSSSGSTSMGRNSNWQSDFYAQQSKYMAGLMSGKTHSDDGLSSDSESSDGDSNEVEEASDSSSSSVTAGQPPLSAVEEYAVGEAASYSRRPAPINALSASNTRLSKNQRKRQRLKEKAATTSAAAGAAPNAARLAAAQGMHTADGASMFAVVSCDSSAKDASDCADTPNCSAASATTGAVCSRTEVNQHELHKHVGTGLQLQHDHCLQHSAGPDTHVCLDQQQQPEEVPTGDTAYLSHLQCPEQHMGKQQDHDNQPAAQHGSHPHEKCCQAQTTELPPSQLLPQQQQQQTQLLLTPWWQQMSAPVAAGFKHKHRHMDSAVDAPDSAGGNDANGPNTPALAGGASSPIAAADKSGTTTAANRDLPASSPAGEGSTVYSTDTITTPGHIDCDSSAAATAEVHQGTNSWLSSLRSGWVAAGGALAATATAVVGSSAAAAVAAGSTVAAASSATGVAAAAASGTVAAAAASAAMATAAAAVFPVVAVGALAVTAGAAVASVGSFSDNSTDTMGPIATATASEHSPVPAGGLEASAVVQVPTAAAAASSKVPCGKVPSEGLAGVPTLNHTSVCVVDSVAVDALDCSAVAASSLQGSLNTAAAAAAASATATACAVGPGADVIDAAVSAATDDPPSVCSAAVEEVWDLPQQQQQQQQQQAESDNTTGATARRQLSEAAQLLKLIQAFLLGLPEDPEDAEQQQQTRPHGLDPKLTVRVEQDLSRVLTQQPSSDIEGLLDPPTPSNNAAGKPNPCETLRTRSSCRGDVLGAEDDCAWDPGTPSAVDAAAAAAAGSSAMHELTSSLLQQVKQCQGMSVSSSQLLLWGRVLETCGLDPELQWTVTWGRQETRDLQHSESGTDGSTQVNNSPACSHPKMRRRARVQRARHNSSSSSSRPQSNTKGRLLHLSVWRQRWLRGFLASKAQQQQQQQGKIACVRACTAEVGVQTDAAATLCAPRSTVSGGSSSPHTPKPAPPPPPPPRNIRSAASAPSLDALVPTLQQQQVPSASTGTPRVKQAPPPPPPLPPLALKSSPSHLHLTRTGSPSAALSPSGATSTAAVSNTAARAASATGDRFKSELQAESDADMCAWQLPHNPVPQTAATAAAAAPSGVAASGVAVSRQSSVRTPSPPPPLLRGFSRSSSSSSLSGFSSFKLQRVPQLLELYQQVRRTKLAALGLGTSSRRAAAGSEGVARVGCGAGAGAPADSAQLFSQIMSTGSYVSKVQADVAKFGPALSLLASSVSAFQPGDMPAVVSFVQQAQQDVLDQLYDETAALKCIPDWPATKWEALWEAAVVHKQLLGLQQQCLACSQQHMDFLAPLTDQAPHAASSSSTTQQQQQKTSKSSKLAAAVVAAQETFTAVSSKLDAFRRHEASLEKRLKAAGIPWNSPQLVAAVKEAAAALSVVYVAACLALQQEGQLQVQLAEQQLLGPNSAGQSSSTLWGCAVRDTKQQQRLDQQLQRLRQQQQQKAKHQLDEAVSFLFKLHQFSGGFDDEGVEAFCRLAEHLQVQQVTVAAAGG